MLGSARIGIPPVVQTKAPAVSLFRPLRPKRVDLAPGRVPAFGPGFAGAAHLPKRCKPQSPRTRRWLRARLKRQPADLLASTTPKGPEQNALLASVEAKGRPDACKAFGVARSGPWNATVKPQGKSGPRLAGTIHLFKDGTPDRIATPAPTLFPPAPTAQRLRTIMLRPPPRPPGHPAGRQWHSPSRSF